MWLSIDTINIPKVLKSCQALLWTRGEHRQSSHCLADLAFWWEYKATAPGDCNVEKQEGVREVL